MSVIQGYHLLSGYYMLSTLHLFYLFLKKLNGEGIIPILKMKKWRLRDVKC